MSEAAISSQVAPVSRSGDQQLACRGTSLLSYGQMPPDEKSISGCDQLTGQSGGALEAPVPPCLDQVMAGGDSLQSVVVQPH